MSVLGYIYRRSQRRNPIIKSISYSSLNANPVLNLIYAYELMSVASRQGNPCPDNPYIIARACFWGMPPDPRGRLREYIWEIALVAIQQRFGKKR
jgi:hypothetical protein